MKAIQKLAAAWAAALLVCVAAGQASALTVEVTHAPVELGQVSTFTAVTAEEEGPVEYRWDFGDGEQTEWMPDQAEVEHTYPEPGHYSVNLLVRDDATPFEGQAFTHTVHLPLMPKPAASSSTIVFDAARNRVYNVNPDNASVTVVDAVELTNVGEIPVYLGPEALAIAPDGKLWVLHKEDYAVAIIDLDTLQVVDGFRLPYGSQPMGLVMSADAGLAYVTLQGLGKLLKIDVATKQTLTELDVGSWARGVALSHDEMTLYVTRFITTGEAGELVTVTAGAGPAPMLVSKTTPLAMDPGPDTDRTGRGLPNYLFSASISPDGREVWVTGKKDNIQRGPARDGEFLTQDNIVRPLVASVDVATGEEDMALRLDLDDRNLPTQVTFSPLGDYAFIVVTGSAFINVRAMYGERVSRADLKEAGLAPRGAVIGPEGKLFVHGFLSRNVVVFDVSGILGSVDFATKKIAEIPTVANDKLTPEQLRGKQVFYDSEDKRMTKEGYISCASCHFDGFEDGRVWDFTERGEGLRNTTSLLGRRGLGHGPVHWTANFDEIQDFEHEIRELFGGTGFVVVEGEAADAGSANINPPLGEPLKGSDADLDALAAYVESLEEVNRSPHRNQDGTLTESGRQGRAIFLRLGCHFCHSGPDFTDSARNLLHDVGTIKELSGQRMGGPLEAIDTPTLLGIWETAPYLHDGSALTLKDSITTANPDDKHGFVSSLSAEEVDQLVAYMQQIDHNQPPTQLPFEPAPAEFVPDDAFDPKPVEPEPSAPPTTPEGMPTVVAPGDNMAAKSSKSFLGCAMTPPGFGGLAWLVSLMGVIVGLLLARRRVTSSAS